MKKVGLLGVLVLSLMLTGCGSTEPNQEQTNTQTGKEKSSENLSSENNITMTTCNDAIKNYLNNANLEGSGVAIKQGDKIVVDYVGRLDDENVFDTSIEDIAIACGKYTDGRDYKSGLPFTVGAGQMIAGFDQGVEGMKIGQTKTITIPAADAYGEWTEEALLTFPKSDIPNADQLQEGMKIMLGNGATPTVKTITNDEITFDFNHELAGKDLIFDITIKSIN